MKTKLIITLFSIFVMFSTINAQTVFIENFAYTAGDSIGAHGWMWNTGTVNNVKVVSPGLTFTGYPLSGVGNAARLSNNGNDYYKQFSADSVISGSVYAAFMVNVDSVKSAGDYFVALLPYSSTSLYTPRIYAKDSLGSVIFGISKSTTGGGPLTYTTTTYPLGSTVLLVAKYTFNPGVQDDSVSLFVFNSTIPSTEPAPSAGPVGGTANDLTNIGRFAVRQGSASNAPTLVIDGIKVTTSWAALLTNVQPISTVASDFSLSQNYPNPFNPVTNIKFSIPANGFVTLKVYDMLGKEVQSLVNNNLTAGTYNVPFNALNLTSGTYIYRISYTNANNIITTDVKKMTLIK